jgi:hypothetical protein
MSTGHPHPAVAGRLAKDVPGGPGSFR